MASLQLVLLFLATACIAVQAQNNQPTCDVTAIMGEVKSELSGVTCKVDFSRLEQRLVALEDKSGQSKPGQTDKKPADCAAIYSQGEKRDGVYTIYPENKEGIRAFCDMTTDGGGWTVFQLRYNGEADFYRGWEEYAQGFGDPEGEYWLGLRYIYALTKTQKSQLYVGVVDFDDGEKYAKYETFSVSSEKKKFRLTVGGYSGTAGDSLALHNRQKFSTKDRDNDKSSGYNCSKEKHGAWWYKKCYRSNLNAQFYATKQRDKATAMNWFYYEGIYTSVEASVMQMRPSSFKP